MGKKDFYSTAHLIVAAIRVLEHRNGIPPTIESLGKTLSFSLEESHFQCRKLHKMGIIDIVEGAFDTKLFIKNHLELEKIPKEKKDTKIQDDLKKFINTKKDISKTVESIKLKKKKKQEDLFADIDQKLKKKLKDKS